MLLVGFNFNLTQIKLIQPTFFTEGYFSAVNAGYRIEQNFYFCVSLPDVIFSIFLRIPSDKLTLLGSDTLTTVALTIPYGYVSNIMLHIACIIRYSAKELSFLNSILSS